MQTLTERLHPYEVTVAAPVRQTGLWDALTKIACDATVLPFDPVSDDRVDEIIAEEARRSLTRLFAAA